MDVTNRNFESHLGKCKTNEEMCKLFDQLLSGNDMGQYDAYPIMRQKFKRTKHTMMGVSVPQFRNEIHHLFNDLKAFIAIQISEEKQTGRTFCL